MGKQTSKRRQPRVGGVLNLVGFLCVNLGTKLRHRIQLIDRRLRSPLRSEFDFADVTPREWEIIRAVGQNTMTAPERLVALIRSIDYLQSNNIDGDIVECGVFRGGSVMAAAHRLNDLDDTNRDVYLYDTFEGMPAPGVEDTDLHGQSATEPFAAKRISDTSSTWARATLEDVQANVFSTGYPRIDSTSSRALLWTLPRVLPDRAALAAAGHGLVRVHPA